jgi:hypothetical protein
MFQKTPSFCPDTGIINYGKGIVTAGLMGNRVAPYQYLSKKTVDKLVVADKVAYRMVESGIPWWVTGTVAKVHSDKMSIDINPEGVHFDSFTEGMPITVMRSHVVPANNFTLWDSKRFWYFGGPRGNPKSSNLLWMERVVDLSDKCPIIESMDLLHIGDTTWLVLGFYRMSGSDTKIVLFKEPHTKDVRCYYYYSMDF